MCRSASDGGRRCPAGTTPAPDLTSDEYIAPTPEQLAAYQASLAAERAEREEQARDGDRFLDNNTGVWSQGDNSPVSGVVTHTYRDER